MAPSKRDAVAVALRSLARREHSERGLRERLRRAGFGRDEVDTAIAELVAKGLLSSERFAAERARVLAERGRGDAAIRFELEHENVESESIEAALASLEPEHERAARLVGRRGAGSATARLLASRGFDEEVVAAAVAHLARPPVG